MSSAVPIGSVPVLFSFTVLAIVPITQLSGTENEQVATEGENKDGADYQRGCHDPSPS